MTKGIYTYYDSKKGKIVYVGKDSNIDKNKRHNAHMYYRNQPINRIIQDNPGRYYYDVLLEEENIGEDILNALEMYYINIYNTYEDGYNYTLGGDGSTGRIVLQETRDKISKGNKGKTKGKKHHNYGKRGKEIAVFKDYPRIIKKGHNSDGTQRWAIKYEGKIWKRSIFKEKLEKELECLIMGKTKEEKHYKYGKIVKQGHDSNGKQIYAIKYEGKIWKRSIFKEKLEKELE